jgi:hypothetical protein
MVYGFQTDGHGLVVTEEQRSMIRRELIGERQGPSGYVYGVAIDCTARKLLGHTTAECGFGRLGTAGESRIIRQQSMCCVVRICRHEGRSTPTTQDRFPCKSRAALRSLFNMFAITWDISTGRVMHQLDIKRAERWFL